MDTASLGGFLRTLLLIVVLYYVFRFVVKYLFPLLIYKAAKKAEQNFQQRQQDFYNQHTNHYTKSTKQTKESGKPKEKKKVGEYIDFEEID